MNKKTYILFFFGIFFSVMSAEEIKPITYSIDEITKKITAGERTTIDEMQFYSFYLMASQGKKHVFANLFWIFFHMGNLAFTQGSRLLEPHIQAFFTKRAFKKKLAIVEEKQYRLEHIIGYEKEKAICLKIIQTIQEAKKIKNAQKKAGILFFGPPGCGKTNFVKTIAAEANVPMLSISMQDLINERGMITNNLHIAFNVIKEYRKKNGPCIIFFDEFDFLIGNRGNEKLDQETKIAIQHFLQQLEDPKLNNVFIFACTNYKDKIDGALLRPGRIGTHIEIDFPKKEDMIFFYQQYQNMIDPTGTKKEEIISQWEGKSVSDILQSIAFLSETQQ